MNRMLIGALDSINNLLAIAILVVGGGLGFFGVQDQAMKLIGLVLGLLGGLIAAAIVCGLLAVLIEIERHLCELVTVQSGRIQPVPRGNGLAARDA